MTAIFYLLLALLGFDVSATTTVQNDRPKTQTQVNQAIKNVRANGSNPASGLKGGGHGGSRNIGGPVIVFDDVLFRPTE